MDSNLSQWPEAIAKHCVTSSLFTAQLLYGFKILRTLSNEFIVAILENLLIEKCVTLKPPQEFCIRVIWIPLNRSIFIHYVFNALLP